MTYDLIIVGGGPAGVTAGIYAARQGLKTLLITKFFGGQLTKKAVFIHNYPGFEKISGIDLTKKFKEHLKSQEIDTKKAEVTKVRKKDSLFSVFTEEDNEFKSKSVIIASGARVRRLDIPGETKFLGKGVSYCVVCDGSLFSGKKVAVIGGGDTGFEAVQFLDKIAEKIYLLEYAPEVQASKKNQEIVKKDDKTEIITNANLKKIQGEEFVNSIVYEDRETKKEKTLEVDGVFIQAGLETTMPDLGDLVEFNSKNRIIFDLQTYETKTPGLFAAGDVGMGKFKQIVIACGEGASVALSAFNYLKSQ